MREVRCLADNIVPSDRCDPSLTPESREECNKQPCLAEISKSTEQWCYRSAIALSESITDAVGSELKQKISL